ncbi:hypothetical protein [Actinomycetospora straminea]|nr:hypothetical protein [Actinomycetospora straminea]MDD7933738.1 hypothetical protein [Actinomycetospora straminea]
MREHLTGPLQAGAAESRLALSPSGTVEMSSPTREPLVLAAPTRSLDDLALSLRVEVVGGDTVVLHFAPGTEAGAALPVLRLAADPGTGLAAPFRLRLSLTQIRGTTSRPVPAAALAEHIELRLVEGVLGRLVYLLGAEKARLRRQARELAGVRRLNGAYGDALDRWGAELGVPRLLDTIRFREPAAHERATVFGLITFGERRFGPGSAGEVTAEARREPDREYRRRLAIYRSWLYPSPAQVRALLNGPGRADEANAGMLADIGITARAAVRDTPRQPAVAVHLVAVDDPELRTGLHEHIRRTALVWPGDSATPEAVHAARYLPQAMREATDELRARLRAAFELPPDVALAPRLAQLLDRVARCRQALGGTDRWRVRRGQDPDGGSRYELGLGADIEPLAAVDLDAMAERLRSDDIDLPSTPTSAEPDPAETRALLAAAQPVDAITDPDGAWLLAAGGLQTVHRIADDLLYVSHLSTFGLSVSGPAAITSGSTVTLEARYHAAGEPGSHALILAGLTASATTWTGAGRDPWQVIDGDDAQDAWNAALVTPGMAAPVLEAAGLPSIEDPDGVATALADLPAELIATLRLAPTTARRITAGRPEAVDELRQLLNTFGEQRLSAALLLVLGDEDVVVVVGGVALPVAGLNLTDRTATLFRWYASRVWPVEPGEPAPVSIGYLGARTELTPRAPGLYAVVALGQVRVQAAGTAPYEFAVELPAGVTISLLQYEYLMNLLAHVHPMGVRVDTSTVRQRHVDLSDDGRAEPIPPDVSRTFRWFRRSRFRGRTAAGTPSALEQT